VGVGEGRTVEFFEDALDGAAAAAARHLDFEFIVFFGHFVCVVCVVDGVDVWGMVMVGEEGQRGAGL
jgi:hypothetical protein